MDNLSGDVARNKRFWESTSEEYQQTHFSKLHTQLNDTECRWGVWGISEDDLRVLGDVQDKDILELGCGGAFWSIRLAKRGARPVALDVSSHQLARAKQLLEIAEVDFPLIEASGDAVPLPDRSFDIVFCDHGAMSWVDPALVMPEVARLLRPGGLFAFNCTTPIRICCYDPLREKPVDRLITGYFDNYRMDVGDRVFFRPTYGQWIRLFRENGFTVEDLIELQPPEGATTTFAGYSTPEWARRWPAEHIWKARREG